MPTTSAVEDNLAALRILEDEAQVQAGAVGAAKESVTLTTDQYRAGTASYLNVVAVQTTALSNQVGVGWRVADLGGHATDRLDMASQRQAGATADPAASRSPSAKEGSPWKSP